MTDKITIERETLQEAVYAMENATMYDDADFAALDALKGALRALLAAQPPTVDGHLKCGHHQSLAINSAETGEFLYCDLCDAKSRCRDAEAMEAELRAALAAQPANPEPVASYWLIECKNGFTGWYTGRRLDCRFFDTDHRKACKFASKELAENEINERGHSCMTATEHVDIAAAQPADAQPTGQSPCARHCEAPAFEGEIRRLKREATIKDSLTIRPPAPAAVPLTDEQIDDICWNFNCSNTPLVEYDRLIARAIEAAHGIAAAGDKP